MTYGSAPSPHHGLASLGQHVVAIRARALALASIFVLPEALVEQVALAHDLGKLATYREEGGRWVRILRHHDRMGSLLLTDLPEWQALPADERTDLRLAVHASTTRPARSRSRRAGALALLAQAHKQTHWSEVDAATLDRIEGRETRPSEPRAVAAPSTTPPAASAAAGAPGTAPATEPAARAVATASAPVPSAVTDPAATPAPVVVAVDPGLCRRMVDALGGALPHLRINHLSMFSGLTIPDADLLMLLAHNLRHVLAGQLAAEDCRRLNISAIEAKTSGGGAKPPIPHASDPAVAAALQQLDWLVERHGNDVGTLWQVDVGRPSMARLLAPPAQRAPGGRHRRVVDPRPVHPQARGPSWLTRPLRWPEVQSARRRPRSWNGRSQPPTRTADQMSTRTLRRSRSPPVR